MAHHRLALDAEPQRVLAVRLDNMGDVIMVGPALRAIRAYAPSARLTLMTSPAGALAASLLPEVDDVLSIRALWQDASGALAFDPVREYGLVAQLAAFGFDAAFIFTSFSQSPFPSAYACYLANVPVRIGQALDFGGGVLSHSVPPAPDGSHQVDRNLHLVERVGIPAPSRAVRVSVPSSARVSADRLLRSLGVEPSRPFVVIAPGASAQARRYPEERFGIVAAALAARLDWPILVVGGAGDVAAAGEIAAAVPSAVSAAGRTTLPEAAAIIRSARLLVCSHSAPLHLADALGVPSVCLFSGTDQESEWRPRATPSVLMRRPTVCAPCRLFDCPIGLRCLDITAERVVAAATALLDAPIRPLDERWLPSAS